jgi:mannan endo-1,4-beta-mannosidase
VSVNLKASSVNAGGRPADACPSWRRYAVLIVGVCLLTTFIALDWSRSAVASAGTASASQLSGSNLPVFTTTETSSAIGPHGADRRLSASSSAIAAAPQLGRPSAFIATGSPDNPLRRVGSTPTTAVTSPEAPTVTSLTPSTVSAGGGASVVITGSGFAHVSAVRFGANASSNFTVLSPTSITATAPTDSGTVDVTVVTAGGTSGPAAASRLTYAPTGQLPITAAGQNLEIGGVPTKFSGVNAYELATSWGTNAGCGGMETRAQTAALFSSLAPGSIVRFWAFQGTLATDDATHEIDWAPIDQVFYVAAQFHVYLIPAITDQGGTCDGGHWQDPAWYAGGYREVFDSPVDSDGRSLTPLSYWTYTQDLVSRYKNSPALGLWEPISEPEASSCAAAYQPDNCSGHQTCPAESVAAADLLSFFNAAGGEIQSLDPVHLVEAGFLGGGQCGTQGDDYRSVGSSSGIDVLSVHDYYGPALLGGDQWNGLAVRFTQAAALDKPIITGEAGILAGNGPSCETLTQRDATMTAKMSAQFAAGSSAFLIWNWVLDPLGPCSYNTGPGDPLVNALPGAVR